MKADLDKLVTKAKKIQRAKELVEHMDLPTQIKGVGE